MFIKTILAITLTTAVGTSISNTYAQNSIPNGAAADSKQDRKEISSERTDIKVEDKMLSDDSQKLSQLKTQLGNDEQKLKDDKGTGNKEAVIADQQQVQQDKMAVKKLSRKIASTRGNLHYYEERKNNNINELKNESTVSAVDSKQDRKEISSERTDIKVEDKMLSDDSQKLSQLKTHLNCCS